MSLTQNQMAQSQFDFNVQITIIILTGIHEYQLCASNTIDKCT